ncbi:MAG: insulinase family protein [Phycisphaerales bacterium]|nr:insulinase family protein [Phycisphaerales bacterium]
MRKIIHLSLGLVLVVCAIAMAQEPAATAGRPALQIEKYVLPNGLQVLLHVDRKLPIVQVNQWFHVGSKNEQPGRTGFAHLFEHLMFQGSLNASGEYFQYVEKAGGSGANGSTWYDRTNYVCSVPSANLEYLLWVESDRLATLMEAMTQEKLDNQREVVKNERRQNYENTPYGMATILMTENLFPKGHPYSWDTIGSAADLNAATLEDVKAFFKTYYTPNNLSICIAGDFDPAVAKKLVEKYFGPIPPGPNLERPKRWIPQLSGEKIVEITDRVALERTYIAWPTPPWFGADNAELDLAARILGDGLSSRLNKALVYDRQVCTDVSADQWPMELSCIFMVDATARPGVSLEQTERIITGEISRLAREGPTEQELSRAKAARETMMISLLERIGGFDSKADLINQYNTYLGDPNKFDEDMDRFARVTTADVQRAAARWLDTPNRLLVRVRSRTAETPATTTTLDRSHAPAFGEDQLFTAPAVQSAMLDNGLQVLVCTRADLPKVSVQVVNKGGTSLDPADKAGLAHLLTTTILRGTTTRDALTISQQMGNLGVTISTRANTEDLRFGIDSLKHHLPEAMALLTDVLRNPTFPQAEVDREKKNTVDALAQEMADPDTLKWIIGPQLEFGLNHPYGLRELPATIESITRQDLVNFYQTHLTPDRTALIFAGDMTLEEAVALAKKHFGDWAGKAASLPPIPPAQPAGYGRIYLVDRPGSAQTQVAVLLPNPPRDNEDYYALRMVNSVYGGSFMSRLNLNIREDKGYAYNAWSHQQINVGPGLWWAYGGVQTDKTREALVEFVKEVRGMAGERPITQSELETAQQRWKRGYPQQFSTLSQVVSQIADLWSQNLPMSEMQRQIERPAEVSLQAVNAAAHRYIVPDQMMILLIGDRAKIEPGIRELNLGPIVPLDVEGRVIKSPSTGD